MVCFFGLYDAFCRFVLPFVPVLIFDAGLNFSKIYRLRKKYFIERRIIGSQRDQTEFFNQTTNHE